MLAIYNFVALGIKLAAYDEVAQKITDVREEILFMPPIRVHVVLAILFVLIAAVYLRKIKDKWTALVAAAGVILTYGWWYYEKFDFLSRIWGLTEGSPEYEQSLANWGILNEAAITDYYALAPAALVVTSVAFFGFHEIYTRTVKSV